jgi:SF3a60/Prp9 C-terminal
MLSVCVRWAYRIPSIFMKSHASKTHYHVHLYFPFPPPLTHFVVSVAEKLKQEGRQEIFQQETMEELEDDEGNVYNKKTYDDLKKQGLI